MLNLVKQFIRDEEGATAVEYGLLVGLMAAAVTAAFAILGPGLETAFQNVVDQMGGGAAADPSANSGGNEQPQG